MGYFSNGSEGDNYEATYCSRCVHRESDDGTGCAVWLAHMLYNYDECNNDKSILHLLIPRAKPIGNKQCRMFHDGREVPNKNQLSMFEEATR